MSLCVSRRAKFSTSPRTAPQFLATRPRTVTDSQTVVRHTSGMRKSSSSNVRVGPRKSERPETRASPVEPTRLCSSSVSRQGRKQGPLASSGGRGRVVDAPRPGSGRLDRTRPLKRCRSRPAPSSRSPSLMRKRQLWTLVSLRQASGQQGVRKGLRKVGRGALKLCGGLLGWALRAAACLCGAEK